MKRLATLSTLALALAAAPAAQAAPPSNDREEGAAPLELNLPVAGDYAEATNDYTLSGATCFTGLGQTPSTAPGPDLVYRFVAPSAGSYVFRVRHLTTVDPVIYTAAFLPAGAAPQVVTGCGDAANRNSVQAAEEPQPSSLAAGQTLFVVVDAAGAPPPGASAYTLVAEQVNSESEPNGTPATANAPSCGVRGLITPAGDVDFWSLGVHPAGSRVFALADGAASGGSNYDMRVTTPVDTLEYDDADADFPFGNNSAVIGGTSLTGAPGYLRVTYANPGIQTEAYRLYSVVRPPSSAAVGEAEPNDTAAQATVTPGYSAGFLADASDTDLFSFTAPAAGRVFIGLDADPLRNNSPFDATLELLDANGTILAVNSLNSSSNTTSGAGTLTSTTPNSPGEGMAVRVPQAGTYYVKVTGAPASIGDYLLSVSSNCQAGALTAPIEIAPPTLPDATVGVPYGVTFAASGGVGAHEFSISFGELPAGLTLTPSGALSGTPATAGAFAITVRATDAEGSQGRRDYTLTVAADTTRPVVSRFRVTNGVFAPVAVANARASAVKRGTRWRFSLSEPATVRITIQRRAAGKRKGRRCVKPTPRLRNRRNCKRFVKRGRVIRFEGRPGANGRFFSGRFGRRALAPRRYRARLVATDPAGNRSRPRTVSFRVRRP